MKDFNDDELNELVSAGKEATRKLGFLKFKRETPQIKELLIFRRNCLHLIRQRATKLNLTQNDLDMINDFIRMTDMP